MASAMPGISPFATPTTALGAVGDSGGPYAPQAQGLQQRLTTSAAQVLQDQSSAAPAAAASAAAADDSNLADFRALEQKLQTEALEKVLPQLDSQVGFVNLKDGDVLPIAQTMVQVKGPLGTRLELTVNGRPLADTQVGKKSSLEETRVLAWEYIGVDLKAGRNTLRVRALDDFGNPRGSAEITVIAPGPLASIILDAPAESVADAATAVAVKVLLRDAEGVPVTARTQITLGATLGQWLYPSDRPDSVVKSAGNQLFITGGSAQLWLLPPAQPGKAELSASSGTVRATRALDFTPNLRPLLGVGLVSASLNLRNLNASALQPAQSGGKPGVPARGRRASAHREAAANQDRGRHRLA
jgi:hypothetical protein